MPMQRAMLQPSTAACRRSVLAFLVPILFVTCGCRAAGPAAPRLPDYLEAPKTLPAWASPVPYSDPAGYTRMKRGSLDYKIYQNMYWQANKWFALLPANDMPNKTVLEDGLSVNTHVVRLPVEDIVSFADNMRLGYLPGNTLLVDFPFPGISDNIGHWAEIMLPTFSVLTDGFWRQHAVGNSRYIDRVLFANMRRYSNDWFQQVFKLALAPGIRPKQFMPPIVDVDSLGEFDLLSWLAFENLIVVQDRYTHPQRMTGFIGPDHGDLWRYDGCERYVSSEWVVGYKNPLHALEFRSKAFALEKWDEPRDWTPGTPPSLPRNAVLLLHSEEHSKIVNVPELADMLYEVAEQHGLRLRLMTLSTDTTFLSQIATMAETALLVVKHGPLLANAVFLPPGAMVLELLPFKWEWQGLSQLFFNMTQSTGDLHHFAWRPLDHKFCQYTQANDSRYYQWTPSECHARECLSVHQRANLIVDIDAVRSILVSKLPRVLAGAPVPTLREPWPPAGLEA